MRLVPDFLSVIRFPLGCLFAVLLSFRFTSANDPVWGLLSCFAFIALSDFIDGKIARCWLCQSYLGSILDVAADSFYIILSLVLLNYYHIIPIWFTAIVVLNLVNFIVSSRIFLSGKKGNFVFDLMGRLTAAGFYFLPVLAGVFPHAGLTHAITLFLAFAAVFSSVVRWISFAGGQQTKGLIFSNANKEDRVDVENGMP